MPEAGNVSTLTDTASSSMKVTITMKLRTFLSFANKIQNCYTLVLQINTSRSFYHPTLIDMDYEGET